MDLKDIKIEEIRGYIQAERQKGRAMREIVKELADNRDDFTILSHDPIIGHQQIIDSLKQYQK